MSPDEEIKRLSTEIVKYIHTIRELERTRSEVGADARVAGYREGAASIISRLRALGITVNTGPSP
jgi:hypothetical protein